MKKNCLRATATVFLFLVFQGVFAQTNQTQPSQISIGIRETLNSKILNEQRRILVYVPNSASSLIYTKQKYPVVYLLDGETAHFASVVGMIQRLSPYSCPEMIVVGIPNTDRTRDLTPTHTNSFHVMGFMDNVSFKTSGGGERFISFIEKELIPHIDSVYPTAPYRIFIGHSLGGLTVINTLVHHTDLFKAYIAIDPALSHDNQKVLKEAKNALSANKFPEISFFMGIANTTYGIDIKKVKRDTTNRTEHLRSILEFRDYLDRNHQNQLQFEYKYYNNDNHNSVPLITEYDAFRFLFGYFSLDLFGFNYAKNLEKIFENASKQFGYKVLPPESLVNSIASLSLSYKYFDEALLLLKLNITNYPQSYNVYNAMGDYFSNKSEKANAIENYKKALSIKEVPSVRQKLEKIQEK